MYIRGLCIFLFLVIDASQSLLCVSDHHKRKSKRGGKGCNPSPIFEHRNAFHSVNFPERTIDNILTDFQTSFPFRAESLLPLNLKSSYARGCHCSPHFSIICFGNKVCMGKYYISIEKRSDDFLETDFLCCLHT